MDKALGDAGHARNHIFISYAWEDGAFAEWLAKILTREGYYVWMDKLKLLGGEPFPKDIELAIDNGTFRVLALMSKYSKDKKSPRRERMLADKAGTAQKIKDFVIPLIVDDLSPNDLDFLTTELTALKFNENWNDGLTALLKKLEKINAPKDVTAGANRLSKLLLENPNCLSSKPEQLISNLFEIEEIPNEILCYQPIRRTVLDGINTEWIYYQSESGMWSFTEPPAEVVDSVKLKNKIEWRGCKNIDGIVPRNVVVNLIYKSLKNYCIQKGLHYSVEDDTLKFLPGFLDNDKIKFTNHLGKKSTVLVTSARTSHYRNNEKVKFRYSIGPEFRVLLDQFSIPTISLGIKLSVSDLNGRPLRPTTALGKRKKTARSWFNNHWLNRKIAILQWLTDGKSVKLLESPSGSLTISPKLINFEVDASIDEIALQPPDDIDPFDFDIVEDAEVQ